MPNRAVSKACFFTLLALLCCCQRVLATDNERIVQELDAIAALPPSEKEQALQRLERLLPELNKEMPSDIQHKVLAALMSKQKATGNKDAAMATAEQLIELGRDQGNDAARSEGVTFKAGLLNELGKHADALLLANEALTYATQSGQLRILQNSHNMVGVIYNDRGDFANALQHYLKALSYGEESDPDNDRRSLLLMTNIGILHSHLKDPKKALEYIDAAYALAEKIDRRRNMATLSINRGGLLNELGQPAEALAAMTRGLDIATDIGDETVQAIALNNLADYYLSQKLYKQAASHAQRAILLGEKINDSNRQAAGRANLGLALGRQGQIRQGVQQIDQAMAIYQQANTPVKQEELYGELSQLYEDAGFYKEALKALRQQQLLSKQLFDSDRERTVSELQEQFDASERHKRIEILVQKNALQASELQNNALEQRIMILLGILGLFVTALIWALYRRTRVANQLLQYQSIRDPLTGLFNRRYFQETMAKRQPHSERRRSTAENNDALVVIDVDFFKRINDSYGHAAGDAVLVEVSQRLAKLMRDTDIVFRWGGEEFLIFLRHIPAAGLDTLVARLLQQLGQAPVQWQNQTLSVTVSAGYISLPFSGLTETEFGWDRALNLADMALYLSKLRGRSRAYGVLRLTVPYDDALPFLSKNLPDAVENGMVVVKEILGPPMKSAVTKT